MWREVPFQERFEIGAFGRGRQQKTFRQSDPYSGKVWQARCDSESRVSAGDAAGAGELVPVDLLDRVEVSVEISASKRFVQFGKVGRARRLAAVCFDDPFHTTHVW